MCRCRQLRSTGESDLQRRGTDERLHIMDWVLILCRPDLWRLQRLQRYCKRPWLHVRISDSREFRVALLFTLDAGVLATLAHNVIVLYSRLCVYPPGHSGGTTEADLQCFTGL